MDNSIVEGFQNLQVLAPFDFGSMGALVEGLTYALEENKKENRNDRETSPQISTCTRKQVKKRKSKKRKPDSKNGNRSDASESSTGLEEALKEFVETVTQHSDSDDVIVVQRISQKKPFQMPACHQLIAESDSFTENFSPMRPHRRRRKFKRMAVDPEPDSNLLDSSVVKEKRIKPKHKSKSKFSKCEMDIEGSSSISDTLPGKRKHLNGHLSDCTDSVEDSSEMCPTPSSAVEDGQLSSQESRESSSISSTESEASSRTPDEARDGDDEQSDFFHEPGPACGIPGIIPWWERGKTCDSDQEQDPSFKQILNGSFELMSVSSRRNFKSRIRLLNKREIRTGRRRLKERKPTYSVARFLQDRQQWNNKIPIPIGSNSAKQTDYKRRRKTPPPSPSGLVGEHALPISEESFGGKLLQGMGWKPGSGLGSEGTGITQPVMAYMRPHRRQGLGMDPANKS